MLGICPVLITQLHRYEWFFVVFFFHFDQTNIINIHQTGSEFFICSWCSLDSCNKKDFKRLLHFQYKITSIVFPFVHIYRYKLKFFYTCLWIFLAYTFFDNIKFFCSKIGALNQTNYLSNWYGHKRSCAYKLFITIFDIWLKFKFKRAEILKKINEIKNFIVICTSSRCPKTYKVSWNSVHPFKRCCADKKRTDWLMDG